jgi:hypothetical protein
MVKTTITAPKATNAQTEAIGIQAFFIKTIMPYA